MDLELEDEDVRIAVTALGAMRNAATNSHKTPQPESSAHEGAGPRPASPSTSASQSATHTPALSLSMTSTHPASSPPHTPLSDEGDSEAGAARFSNHNNLNGNSSADDPPSQGPTYPSLARMQNLPLVSGALRVYEAGKANSRVVQYTSSLVSSSLRHASSRLPAGSGERMDEIAGGMLDRLERYGRSPAPPPPASPDSADQRRGKTNGSLAVEEDRSDGRGAGGSGGGRYREIQPRLDGAGYAYAPYDERGMELNRERGDTGRKSEMYSAEEGGSKSAGKRRWDEDESAERVPTWLEATSPFVAPPPPPPTGRGKQRGERERDASGEERQVAQRSRWQAMLLEAGGLSASLSDESMRRLRYCLQWLQYATQHIDAQILILRDFIASLRPRPPPAAAPHSPVLADPPPPELTPDHLRTLTHLRSDIVHTIRQVVGVVSRYAGGALPEPARGRVRGFILDLPRKFDGGGDAAGDSATASGSGVGSVTGTGTAARRGARRERGAGAGADAASHPGSPAGSRPSSPHLYLRPLNPHAPSGTGAGHNRRGSTAGGGAVETGRAMAAAQRVLTLATESLDMMRGVTAVVGESLDRADAWVDRFRTVGIQRGMDGLALPGGGGGEARERERWGAGATPAWRSTSTSVSGADTPGAASSRGAPSPGYVGAPSPGYADGEAPSPGFGLGAMSLGERERYAAEEERDRERKRARQRDEREAEHDERGDERRGAVRERDAQEEARTMAMEVDG
ncbi:transcription factor Opi1-domain-containing protein [Mycena pura]|uniref:Transcription factor Opi1-domain-containing protein n=1 Tax=Mycena pura TaxID=153505 RepID=A0AAD7E5Q7_9AGAR|nr:transcription factor Opi1-domain-containing protein [Mycena pura]